MRYHSITRQISFLSNVKIVKKENKVHMTYDKVIIKEIIFGFSSLKENSLPIRNVWIRTYSIYISFFLPFEKKTQEKILKRNKIELFYQKNKYSIHSVCILCQRLCTCYNKRVFLRGFARQDKILYVLKNWNSLKHCCLFSTSIYFARKKIVSVLQNFNYIVPTRIPVIIVIIVNNYFCYYDRSSTGG